MVLAQELTLPAISVTIPMKFHVEGVCSEGSCCEDARDELREEASQQAFEDRINAQSSDTSDGW